MISTSSLRARTVSGARRGLNRVLIGTAALVPALSMGVTVPAAVELQSAETDCRESSALVERRDRLYRELEPYRGTALLIDLRTLGGTVKEMIPRSGSPLDEFGWIRSLCAERELGLTSIQTVGTKPASQREDEAPTVVVDETVVTLHCAPAGAFALVSDLRGAGHPLVVLGFNLSRSNATESSFQVELRLGFLRRPTTSPADGVATR